MSEQAQATQPTNQPTTNSPTHPRLPACLPTYLLRSIGGFVEVTGQHSGNVQHFFVCDVALPQNVPVIGTHTHAGMHTHTNTNAHNVPVSLLPLALCVGCHPE